MVWDNLKRLNWNQDMWDIYCLFYVLFTVAAVASDIK